MSAGVVAITVVQRGNVRTAMSGAFEVTAAGSLIHSKLTIKGHGKCETSLERRRVLTKLQRIAAGVTAKHDSSSR